MGNVQKKKKRMKANVFVHVSKKKTTPTQSFYSATFK